MTEHLSSETLELLTGHRLAPGDLLFATRHLATCVECRERAGRAADAFSRAHRVRSDLQLPVTEAAHPDYEQIEAYVDDLLAAPDREAVKQHFSLCAACLEEARELELLRDNLTTYPALAAVPAATRQKGESSWDRLAGFFQMRPRQLAFLAAALVLIAVVAVLLLRRPVTPQIVNRNSAPGNSNEGNQNNQLAGTNSSPPGANQSTPKDGGEVVAASPYEALVNETIEAQKITIPAAIRDLQGKDSALMGSNEKQDRFALKSPVATLIRDSRPTFRWQSLPGASSYSVAILDLNLNLIEKSDPAANLSWTPRQPLKRNVIYTWQVTAVKDGREITAPAAPDREARFKILSSEKSAALTRVPTEISGSHLKLGIVYAHEGLLDDAEREFRASIAADQDAALARKFLLNVRLGRK